MKELIQDVHGESIQGFPLCAGGIGASSTTIDTSNSTFITFDAEVTIQLNGVGETFTVPPGSCWTIDSSVTSITVGSATKYILA